MVASRIALAALARYGAGDVEQGVELMRYVFKVKRTLATNNPDDIVLLQAPPPKLCATPRALRALREPREPREPPPNPLLL